MMRKACGWKRLLPILWIVMCVGAQAEQPAAMPEHTGAPSREYALYAEEEAMRGVSWALSLEEVAQIEQVKPGKKAVTVKSVTLYQYPMDSLTYTFQEGKLNARKFTLRKKKNWDVVVYAVFMRYGPPTFYQEGDYLWELPDMQIVLHHASKPTLTFTVRRAEEEN